MRPRPRIVVAGAVSSTRRILTTLLRNHADVVGVLGLDPAVSRGVSGYSRLDDIAHEAGVPFAHFRKIGAPDIVETVRSWQPDLLFAVGLSQLVGPELHQVPTKGTIGFHPTLLPRGRGRAPLAWLVLNERAGAATFFVIDDGVDAGPIVAQARFEIDEGDDAGIVMAKIEDAIEVALDDWIPRLDAGEWAPVAQDHDAASITGKRGPVDGLIEWGGDASDLVQLVRAATRPHPGAYTHFRDRVLRVWQATVVDRPVVGVVSRVVDFDEGRPVVQAGEGLLRLDETSWDGGDGPAFSLGMSLGYRAQHQIHQLRSRVAELESRLSALEKA